MLQNVTEGGVLPPGSYFTGGTGNWLAGVKSSSGVRISKGLQFINTKLRLFFFSFSLKLLGLKRYFGKQTLPLEKLNARPLGSSAFFLSSNFSSYPKGTITADNLPVPIL